ncbi:hypothetical protein LY78DRAFT_686727 [Colletotrichum sublineola]|nr:hypothetical protein LY78DRAFT_686727 [Colletotrichum sublineola]
MSSYDSDASDASGASGASAGSIRSCIEVQPADLAAACTDRCVPERCDNRTVRPDEPPEDCGPPDSFIPMEVPDRAPLISELPDSPVNLFLRYIPRDLIARWVTWTNIEAEGIHGPFKRYSRMSAWRNTSIDEVYLFISILYMTRDRFQILFRRLRIFNPSDFQPGPARPNQMPDVYRKVSEWSAHIQETGDSFYSAGAEVTVDEAMVWFMGRSKETTTIPTKPITTGFKIWILAQFGYCLRWLWHVHGKGPYGLVPQARPAIDDSSVKVAQLTLT